jgi:hypothetical protein
VYPVEPDTGDAPEVVGQRRAHLEELLHPRSTVDADVECAFGIQMPYRAVYGQSGAAGNRPCGCQTVFVRQLAKAAR